jgi:predicted AAA+ superfamily ATPase
MGKIDYQAEEYALHYLRTKDGVEVDFVLVKDDAIVQIIEAKHADKEISKSLYSFSKKYQLPAVQVVHNLRQERVVDQITVLRAINFLSDLYL